MHKYIDPSNFRAVLETAAIDLRGNEWPEARAYYETSQVRSPYRGGFYQDNQLRGLGVTQTIVQPPTPVPLWLVLGGSFFLGYVVGKTMFG